MHTTKQTVLPSFWLSKIATRLVKKAYAKRSMFGALVVSAVALAGCSSNAPRTVSNNPNDYANVGSLRNPLGSAFNNISVPQNVSRVVYYRTGGGAFSNAATVYLNDDYHASLIPGSYSDVCVAPGAVRLGTRLVDVRGGVKDGFDSVTPATLKGGQTTYVRVRENGSRATLEPVSQAVALQELANTRLQRHTISRVSQAVSCNGGPATKSQFDLRADALFAFGRSDLNSMTAEGRQSLNDLIQKIRDNYVAVQQIALVGHTDPFGSAAANQQLSLARANTVRNYLQNNGLQGVQMTTEGRGPTQLVQTGCGATASAEAIRCNQPNRRVSVEVTGAAR